MYRKNRTSKGYAVAEFAASLMLLLPILIAGVFLTIESAQIYMVNSVLNQCAATAARKLAIAYGHNPAGVMANPDIYFSQVTFNNIVQSYEQFSIPSGTAGWNITGNPPTVTVVVTFQGGTHGCPMFPNPDPLGLGSHLVLSATSTSRLE